IFTPRAVHERAHIEGFTPSIALAIRLVYVEVAKVEGMTIRTEIEDVELVMEEGAHFEALGGDDRSCVDGLLPFSVRVAHGIVNIRQAEAPEPVGREEECVAIV